LLKGLGLVSVDESPKRAFEVEGVTVAVVEVRDGEEADHGRWGMD
jgi:hypothetical protein